MEAFPHIYEYIHAYLCLAVAKENKLLLAAVPSLIEPCGLFVPPALTHLLLPWEHTTASGVGEWGWGGLDK